MVSPSSDCDSQLAAPTLRETESQLSSVLYDTSQQVQVAMGNMLKMIVEIDQNSAAIIEEIGKCKDFALEKKQVLEEEKERFQKAVYTVLQLLNN